MNSNKTTGKLPSLVIVLLYASMRSCLSLKNESHLISGNAYKINEIFFANELFGSNLFGVDVYDPLLVICSEKEFTRSISSGQFRTLCPGIWRQFDLVREHFLREAHGQRMAKELPAQSEVLPSQQFTDGEPGPSAGVDEVGNESHKMSRRALEQLTSLRAYPASTSSSSVPDKQIKAPDDLYLLTPDLIRHYGYPAEVHDIRTSDGYFLTLHRIVGTRQHNTTTTQRDESHDKKVVLLLHGFAGSSADYVIGGPDSALGFMLVDAGFDVWLGNFRGNTYSRKHASLDTDKADYWKFSLDDLARRDVPAMVAHILSTTKQKSIACVGHSVGATVMTMATFIKPMMAKKVHYFAAMAPIGFGKKSTGPVKVMTNLARITYKHIEETAGSKAEVLSRDRHAIGAVWLFCNGRSVFWKMCLSLLTSAAGRNDGLFRKEMLPYILAHFPAGTSVRLAAHLGQLLSTDGVQFFDLGRDRNTEVYGQATPQQYDLKHVTCPVAVYWAENDILAHPLDVQQFISSLPNVVEKMQVGHETFNHYDFLYSNQARQLVHTDLIKMLKKHGQGLALGAREDER